MFNTLQSAVQGLGYTEFYLRQTTPVFGAVVSLGTALDSGARAVGSAFEGVRTSLYVGNVEQGRQCFSDARQFSLVFGNNLLNVCSFGFLNRSLVGQGLLRPVSSSLPQEERSLPQVAPTIRLTNGEGEEFEGSLVLSPGIHSAKLQHDAYTDFSDKEFKKGDEVEIEIKHPVYQFQRARFSGMSKHSSCLVLGMGDFNRIQDIVHTGAFGQDYRQIQDTQELKEKYLEVVWKIPADLLHISGYQGGVSPVSVGTYSLMDDSFEKDQTGFDLIGCSATKMRIDRKVEGHAVVSIHYFEVFPSKKVLAGISMGNFFQNFNRPTDEEYARIGILLQALKDCGVVAFSSNCMHHAIVLYAKEQDSKYTLMTPELFADLLQSSPRIFEAIQTSANKDMRPWKEAFIQTFAKRLSAK